MVTDTSEETIKNTKCTTKALEALSQPNKSILYPLLQLASDQELISSDLIDELVEVMTMKSTSQFIFIHDKNLGLDYF